MTVFEINVNGKRINGAGLDEPGVVVTSVTWLRGKEKELKRPSADHIAIRVGGMKSGTGDHIVWHTQKLKIGDEVKILIIEQRKADAPERVISKKAAMAGIARMRAKLPK